LLLAIFTCIISQNGNFFYQIGNPVIFFPFIAMNIYNRSPIIEFYSKHAHAKLALEVWYEDVTLKHWKSPNHLKKDYGGNVSILKNNRVVFDIKANDFRLVAAINYEHGWIFIKFIGTHAG
jgi:mRNA interferase HigB